MWFQYIAFLADRASSSDQVLLFTRNDSLSSGIRNDFRVLKFSNYERPNYEEYLRSKTIDMERISISYKSLPANHTVVIITASGRSISPKLNNTMMLLSLYEKVFNIRPVIMTDSEVISYYAKSLQFDFIRQTEANSYGMPILRSILMETRRKYSAKQYIYINSDILLNPGVFSVSKYFDKYFEGNQYLLAGTVYDTPEIPTNMNYSSLESFITSFSKYCGRRRGVYAIDVFVFPHSYPFELLMPVVVGRWRIDNYILHFSHSKRIPVVDLTLIKCAHQGVDKSNRLKSKIPEDVLDLKYDGILRSNYTII